MLRELPSRRRAVPFLLLLSSLLFAAPAAEARWTPVGTFDGVVVSSRKIPGQDMPEFRGVAVINARIVEILAVIDDAKRHCEWMARCAESRILRQLKGFDRIVYQRLDAPWPVSDRDLVVRGTIRVDEERREVLSSFRSVTTSRMPHREGVVRITALKGFYHLKAMDDGKTRVTYQVYADPGGSLPRWLARKAAQKIPAETITTLRRQVARTRGQYRDFVERYDPDRGGRIPETTTR